MPIDIYHNKNRNSKLKNMSRNICYGNDQILSLPKIPELNGFNVLNMSSETFCDEQNNDVIETKNLSNTQSQICFISRDPKNIQTDYNISKLEMNNSNNVQSAKYLRKRRINISDNLNVLKKIKNKNDSILNQPERNTPISKKSLSEKIKKNSSFKHIKYFSQTKNVIQNSLNNIKTTKLKQIKEETKPLSTSNMNESWAKQTFSDISFSDLDEMEQTQITMKNDQYKYFNKIDQDPITLEHNDTWEKHMHNSYTDMESQSNNSENNNISVNSSNENSKSLTHTKHNVYNTSSTSSFIFSDDSVLEPNWSVNSLQSNSNKREFTELSQYSSDSNDDEKSKNQNTVTKLFNNIAFKQILYSKSKQNKTLASI